MRLPRPAARMTALSIAAMNYTSRRCRPSVLEESVAENKARGCRDHSVQKYESSRGHQPSRQQPDVQNRECVVPCHHAYRTECGAGATGMRVRDDRSHAGGGRRVARAARVTQARGNGAASVRREKQDLQPIEGIAEA